MTKTAIVTGGARGIGRGCALELAARGYDIALVDLLDPEMARTKGEIEAKGRKALTYKADVSVFARAHEVVADVAKEWGHIDFLLNDAGASNAWYGTDRGPFIYQEITGDFIVVARVFTGTAADHAMPPTQVYNVGGIMARADPGGGMQEDWVLLDIGRQGGAAYGDSVDVGSIVEIHRFVNELADTGMAVIVISSYLPEILALSDRILVARQGRIVEEMDSKSATEQRIMYAAVH